MMGTLKETSGKTEEDLALSDGADIASVIRGLINEHGEELKKALLDPVNGSPLPNILILLNGIEINNIHGLSTPVGNDDTLVLLPVTHGG